MKTKQFTKKFHFLFSIKDLGKIWSWSTIIITKNFFSSHSCFLHYFEHHPSISRNDYITKATRYYVTVLKLLICFLSSKLFFCFFMGNNELVWTPWSLFYLFANYNIFSLISPVIIQKSGEGSFLRLALQSARSNVNSSVVVVIYFLLIIIILHRAAARSPSFFGSRVL